MVLSERRRRNPNAGTFEWLASADPAHLFVSAISFGEIAAGMENKRVPPQFLDELANWLAAVQLAFRDRTIPVDTGVAIRWGAMYARLGRSDVDLLIAATALEHDLTLVTRNVRHFESTGVRILDPYR